MFKKLNPLKLMIYWLFLLLVISIIVIPILFATTVGGEQRPLTFLVYMILFAVYGTLILSVVTPIFYFDWFKKYWYVNLIFFVLSGYYVIKDQKRNARIEYSFKEKTDHIGNDEIRTVKEYYSLDPEKIRSESYWRNEKKDSTWTVYAKDGSIISKEKYKDGQLVK
jgi:hypothetical protein